MHLCFQVVQRMYQKGEAIIFQYLVSSSSCLIGGIYEKVTVSKFHMNILDKLS